jgi:hypothetical protein
MRPVRHRKCTRLPSNLAPRKSVIGRKYYMLTRQFYDHHYSNNLMSIWWTSLTPGAATVLPAARDRIPNPQQWPWIYLGFFSCSIAARRIALIRIWYRGYCRKGSSTSRSSRMLICSFGFGITSVAKANQVASRIGAASGSLRTASSISASVSTLTRAQLVRRRSASAPDLFFEEALLTRVSLSRRDNAAIFTAPRVNDNNDTFARPRQAEES